MGKVEEQDRKPPLTQTQRRHKKAESNLGVVSLLQQLMRLEREAGTLDPSCGLCPGIRGMLRGTVAPPKATRDPQPHRRGGGRQTDGRVPRRGLAWSLFDSAALTPLRCRGPM